MQRACRVTPMQVGERDSHAEAQNVSPTPTRRPNLPRRKTFLLKRDREKDQALARGDASPGQLAHTRGHTLGHTATSDRTQAT